MNIVCSITGKHIVRQDWYGEGEHKHSKDRVCIPVQCDALRGWKGYLNVYQGNYALVSDGSLVIDGKVSLYLPNPQYLKEDGTCKPGIVDPGGYSFDGKMVEMIKPDEMKNVVIKNAKAWEQLM